MATPDLTGRTIAITGAARGIGLATARACAAAGARVAIGDLDGELAAEAAQRLGAGPGLGVDVRDEASFEAFLEASDEQLGGLDGLVNNAGVLFLGPVANEDAAHARAMVEVNLLGTMAGSRLAVRRFLAQGRGHIVNVASSASQVAVAGGATYAATKHGVLGYTRALRAELRGTGVRTTVVMPGIVRTDMIRGFQPAIGTREVEPEAVGEAIASALARGRQEIYVPRELGLAARLMAGLPPRGSDALKRLMGADRVMLHADTAKRGDYDQRAGR